jgi:hypothetical protein
MNDVTRDSINKINVHMKKQYHVSDRPVVIYLFLLNANSIYPVWIFSSVFRFLVTREYLLNFLEISSCFSIFASDG